MRKHRKNGYACRRLLAVKLRAQGLTNEQVAAQTDYHPARVGQLVTLYHKRGAEGLAEDNRKGGNHRNMSVAEAEAFLSEFEERAKKGNIVDIAEIAAEYDKRTGKEHKSRSSVYYLLKNHKWRTIMPRAKHPKSADKETIEVSKKLTLNTRK